MSNPYRPSGTYVTPKAPPQGMPRSGGGRMKSSVAEKRRIKRLHKRMETMHAESPRRFYIKSSKFPRIDKAKPTREKSVQSAETVLAEDIISSLRASSGSSSGEGRKGGGSKRCTSRLIAFHICAQKALQLFRRFHGLGCELSMRLVEDSPSHALTLTRFSEVPGENRNVLNLLASLSNMNIRQVQNNVGALPVIVCMPLYRAAATELVDRLNQFGCRFRTLVPDSSTLSESKKRQLLNGSNGANNDTSTPTPPVKPIQFFSVHLINYDQSKRLQVKNSLITLFRQLGMPILCDNAQLKEEEAKLLQDMEARKIKDLEELARVDERERDLKRREEEQTKKEHNWVLQRATMRRADTERLKDEERRWDAEEQRRKDRWKKKEKERIQQLEKREQEEAEWQAEMQAKRQEMQARWKQQEWQMRELQKEAEERKKVVLHEMAELTDEKKRLEMLNQELETERINDSERRRLQHEFSNRKMEEWKANLVLEEKRRRKLNNLLDHELATQEEIRQSIQEEQRRAQQEIAEQRKLMEDELQSHAKRLELMRAAVDEESRTSSETLAFEREKMKRFYERRLELERAKLDREREIWQKEYSRMKTELETQKAHINQDSEAYRRGLQDGRNEKLQNIWQDGWDKGWVAGEKGEAYIEHFKYAPSTSTVLSIISEQNVHEAEII